MTTAINTDQTEQKTAYEKHAQNMPERFRDNYIKAMTGKSRVRAVKAKCLDCSCWQPKEITLCPVSTCPLYQFRPYQRKRQS